MFISKMKIKLEKWTLKIEELERGRVIDTDIDEKQDCYDHESDKDENNCIYITKNLNANNESNNKERMIP